MSALCQQATSRQLIDHLVGDRKQRRRHGYAERSSPQRYSIVTFWPSTKPVSFKPCLNAATSRVPLAADVLRRNPITGVACCARHQRHRHRTTQNTEKFPPPH